MMALQISQRGQIVPRLSDVAALFQLQIQIVTSTFEQAIIYLTTTHRFHPKRFETTTATIILSITKLITLKYRQDGTFLSLE
jgi:hypothetical protein